MMAIGKQNLSDPVRPLDFARLKLPQSAANAAAQTNQPAMV